MTNTEYQDMLRIRLLFVPLDERQWMEKQLTAKILAEYPSLAAVTAGQLEAAMLLELAERQRYGGPSS